METCNPLFVEVYKSLWPFTVFVFLAASVLCQVLCYCIACKSSYSRHRRYVQGLVFVHRERQKDRFRSTRRL